MDNLPAVTAELAQIETLMRDNSPLYWKDDARQARYRDLLDARDGRFVGDDDAGDDEDDPFARGELEAVSVREFEAAQTGTSFDEYLRTVSIAADIVMAVPSSERRSLVDGFDALPDEVAGVLAEELGNRLGTGYAPIPDDVVRAFSREKGGRVVREWGHEAQRLMGRVHGRLNRCMSQLDGRGLDAFLDWHDDLTDGQAAAIYRKLAA